MLRHFLKPVDMKNSIIIIFILLFFLSVHLVIACVYLRLDFYTHGLESYT